MPGIKNIHINTGAHFSYNTSQTNNKLIWKKFGQAKPAMSKTIKSSHTGEAYNNMYIVQ